MSRVAQIHEVILDMIKLHSVGVNSALLPKHL